MLRGFGQKLKKFSGLSIPNHHPSTWALDVLQAEVCSPSAAAMLVCGAWTLWTGRNARRHGRKVWEPGATVRYISSLLEDLASLKTPVKEKGASFPSVWRCPEEGWVKVNTDPAFDADSCTGSAGVVIRDHKGLVMAAATRWFDKVPDALTAEAMAAKEAVAKPRWI